MSHYTHNPYPEPDPDRDRGRDHTGVVGELGLIRRDEQLAVNPFGGDVGVVSRRDLAPLARYSEGVNSRPHTVLIGTLRSR